MQVSAVYRARPILSLVLHIDFSVQMICFLTHGILPEHLLSMLQVYIINMILCTLQCHVDHIIQPHTIIIG